MLATNSSGVNWIVEVKWKNKRAGKKELAKLVGHAQDRNPQGWYISKAGFTLETLSFAIEHGIYDSDEASLQELKRILS